jgi:predicted enzyme related to lactoylglutathione lyase
MQLFLLFFRIQYAFNLGEMMKLKSMDLVWIVVNDLKKAIEFYTHTLGLELKEFHEQYGWAELEGKNGGARLGIAQCQIKSEDDLLPGQNAVMTFTVENLNAAVDRLLKQQIKLIGSIQEIPGHVKMQMVADTDGNRFQLVEVCHQCCPGH